VDRCNQPHIGDFPKFSQVLDEEEFGFDCLPKLALQLQLKVSFFTISSRSSLSHSLVFVVNKQNLRNLLQVENLGTDLYFSVSNGGA